MNSLSSGSATKSNIWFSVSLGLIGIIVGYTLAGIVPGSGGKVAPTPIVANPTPTAAPTPAPAANIPALDAKADHYTGSPNAKLTLVTYTDFECPFCKRHHATIQQILSTYKDTVNVVYRYFPLSFHQNGQKEAEAAECAADQGGDSAFWKFADGIFAKTTSNGTGFALDQLGPLAKSIGLDQAKFQTCLDSGTFAQKVKSEEDAGSNAGVSGTPANFLVDNTTKKIQEIPGGAIPFSSFKTAIDAALAAK